MLSSLRSDMQLVLVPLVIKHCWFCSWAKGLVFAWPAVTPTLPCASRAATASEAWLAPENKGSGVGVDDAPAQSSSLALVPWQGSTPGSAESPSQPAASAEAWVWQVHAGKRKKRFWKTVSDDLAAILEHAHVTGSDSCTWTWDGWTYYYEMSTMTQTSPGEDAQERSIRRIPYSEAYPDDD